MGIGIELIHRVISDLDYEMNTMLEYGDATDDITAEGHRKMIEALDEYCESIGFPCETLEEII